MRRFVVSLLALPALAGGAAAQTAPVALDTLRVEVGSRASAALPVAARAVQVIGAEALAATPGRTLADALAWAVGVDVQPRSPAQADLALRGASFEQVLVLVDGVRTSDPQTGHFDLDLAVPLEEIERIEILRGPATALYGSDAVGGVVNVVTRRGARGLSAALEGGAFGSAALSLSAGAGGPALAGRVGAEWRRSDGHRPGTDYEALQLRAALDRRLGSGTLRADVAHAARDFGARAFYTPPAAPYDEYEETRATTASLGWTAGAGARLAIEPRLTLRRHGDDFLLMRDDPSFYRNRHTSWQRGGEIVARYAATPALGLVVGAEAYRDRLESTALGVEQNADGLYIVEEDRGAAFAEAVVGRADGALLNAGLRLDHHSTFGTFVAPSLAVALSPTGALRLRASVGRAFRAPSWTERFYRDPANVGDPDLDPERAWEAELGAELAPAAGLRIAATGFLRRADGLIDWARPADAAPTEPWRTRNVERATFRGLEIEAAAAAFAGLRWNAGLTLLDFQSESTGGRVSKYALRPLDRTASLALERAFGSDFTLSARALYSRRAGEPGEAIRDGACVPGARQELLRTDARATYRFRGARLFLDLLNLADAASCDVSALPGPGRAAYVGIAWGTGR